MIFLKKYWIKLTLTLLILCYSIYFSWFTVLRYQTLYASYFDLGIMHQTVFNTYKALQTGDYSRFLEFTDPLGSSQIKRMAFHNDIILALLAPFYFFSSTPATLLVIQTLVVAFGAWAVFLISQTVFEKLKYKDVLSLTFGFSYLMNPVLQRANIYDFHAVTLATTLLLFMFYFWLKKRYYLSFLFLILSLMTKEQVSLTTAFFGLYVLYSSSLSRSSSRFHSNDKVFSLTVLITSVVWFIGSIFVVIPYFRGGHHFALARYSDFGDTPSNVLLGFFKNPLTIIQRVFHPDTYRYLLFLLGPVGFLSLLSLPVFLIATPEFAINLLSKNWNMRNVIYQYTAVIQPFIFISAIYGAKAVIDYAKKRHNLKFIEKYIHPFVYPQEERVIVREWAAKLKNDNVSVTTTGQLSPFFTNRRYFYNFSPDYHLADYVVLRLNEIYNYPEKKILIPVYEQLVRDPNYMPVYKVENFEVYKKIK